VQPGEVRRGSHRPWGPTHPRLLHRERHMDSVYQWLALAGLALLVLGVTS